MRKISEKLKRIFKTKIFWIVYFYSLLVYIIFLFLFKSTVSGWLFLSHFMGFTTAWYLLNS